MRTETAVLLSAQAFAVSDFFYKIKENNQNGAAGKGTESVNFMFVPESKSRMHQRGVLRGHERVAILTLSTRD